MKPKTILISTSVALTLAAMGGALAQSNEVLFGTWKLDVTNPSTVPVVSPDLCFACIQRGWEMNRIPCAQWSAGAITNRLQRLNSTPRSGHVA